MNKNRLLAAIAIAVIISIGCATGIKFREKQLYKEACPNDDCSEVVKDFDNQNTEDEKTEKEPSESKAPKDTEETKTEENADSKEEAEASEGEAKYIDRPAYVAAVEPRTESDAVYGHNLYVAGLKNYLEQRGVEGILFSAGTEIYARGEQDYLAVAGSKVSVESKTKNDAYIVGSTIEFTDEASTRDVYLAGGRVILRGKFYGTVHGAAGELILDGAKIYGDVNVVAGTIEMKNEATIKGRLTYPKDTLVKGLDKEKIGAITILKTPNTNADVAIIILKAITTVVDVFAAVAFLTSLLCCAAPKRYKTVVESKGFGKNLLFGILSVLIVPFLAVILFISAYFSLVGVLFLILFIAIVIAGAGIGCVRLGNIICKNIIKGSANKASIVFFGALGFAALAVLPVVGAAVIIAFVMTGTGQIVRMITTENPLFQTLASRRKLRR